MPVHVNEIVVRATIADTVQSAAATTSAGSGGGGNNEQIIAECVEKVLDIIRREQKR
jgi:Family of unknown function (DUF5908)